jgi:phosphinothricin acetyltransferase
MGLPSAADLDFVARFERCEFTMEAWDHEAHVRMAWTELSRARCFADGVSRIRAGIQRFNASVGSMGYHETVTVAFSRLIHARILAAPPRECWLEFVAGNPDLLAKRPSPLEPYYGADFLRSARLRAEFVPPTFRDLPLAGSLREAEREDAKAIREIYAPFVRETAVSFEITVPDEAEMARRIEDVRSYASWLVFVDEARKRIAGYAYGSKHRSREAYRWALEVSVYVDEPYRRQGVARILYRRLFHRLAEQGYFTALAGVALPNPGSVGFHQSMGFTPVGIFHRIGYKFGSWHDVGWWQTSLQPEGKSPIRS